MTAIRNQIIKLTASSEAIDDRLVERFNKLQQESRRRFGRRQSFLARAA